MDYISKKKITINILSPIMTLLYKISVLYALIIVRVLRMYEKII